MKIKCPQCSQTAQIDDEKVPLTKTAVRCRLCDTLFDIKRPLASIGVMDVTESAKAMPLPSNDSAHSKPQRTGKKPIWFWVFLVISLIMGISGTAFTVFLAIILFTPDPFAIAGYIFGLLSTPIIIIAVLSILQLFAGYVLIKSYAECINKTLIKISVLLNVPIIVFGIYFNTRLTLSLIYYYFKRG